MSSTDATQSDKHALVSSFYGPGAVVGWYLTALACLVSFSLHPRKRTRDSITADLIAVLSFPAIAAADLITKVPCYPKEGAVSVQNAASIEATLTVTETFLAIDVVLILLAVGHRCIRRGCLLGTVGLFCFSAECYVYFSPFVNPAVGQQLGRLFLIDYGDLLISVMVVLSICIGCALGLIALFSLLPYEPHAQSSGRNVEATRREGEQDFDRSRSMKGLTIISFVVLPWAFVTSMFPLSSNVVKASRASVVPWIRTAASRLAHDLIPQSNTSIQELDQTATLLAGASVLGFALYSTADTYYQVWLSATRAEAQQEETELRTLNHNRIPRRWRRLCRLF